MAITFLVLLLLLVAVASVKLIFFPSGKNTIRATPLPRFFVQEKSGMFYIYDRQSLNSIGSAYDSMDEATDALNMLYVSESKY